jgi:hypothetical protein
LCNERFWNADGRPKLITGSFEGYPGHVDGKLRDARMNHPKGLTVDERGNIYVADTMNMAIRKISTDGGDYCGYSFSSFFFLWPVIVVEFCT